MKQSALVFALLALATIASANTSKYTSIKVQDCKKLEDSSQDPEAEIDSYEGKCKGKKGYEVHVVSGDARSWLVFKKAGKSADTYEAVMSHAPGTFPTLASEKIEWRLDDKKSLKAVIFRIVGNDAEQIEKSYSKLFVVRPDGDKACLLGTALTNEEARGIADTATACL